MQDLIVRVGADISGLSNSLRMASQQVTQFAQRSQQGLQAIGNVGKTMATVGAVGVAGLGAAVKVAADFEYAMSRVGALSGATAKELKQLTQTAEHLGATTVYSSRDAAEGMQFLAMAGYKTNEIIEAMPGLLNAAAAGQTDLGTTADIVSNILSGFGLEAKETGRVADVLTKAFTSANVDLQMLGYTMKYTAPIAKSAGQSLETMAASAGILGNAGIQAEQAGTSLRAILIRLSAPPSEAAKQLDRLGISVKDSRGNMKNLAQIIGELNDATKDMSQTEKVATISKIAGVEASSAMLTLMEAGQGTIEQFTKELENSGGVAEEIANKQLDNLTGQIILLKSALEGAAIAIGNAVLPAIKLLVRGVQGVLNWFNGLSDASKRFLAIGFAVSSLFTLIGGSMLILLAFIPSIVQGFGLIATSLGMSSAALLRMILMVGGLVGGIALLVTALVLAYNEIEWLNKAVKAVGRGIVDGFKIATQAVEDFGGYLSNLAITTWPIIVSGAGAAVDAVKRFGEAMKPELITAYTWALEGLGKVSDLIGKGVQKLADSGITVMDVMRNLAGPATTVLTIFLGLQGPIGLVASALVFLATRTNIVTDMIKVFKGEMEFSDAIDSMGDMASAFITNMAEMLAKSIEVGAEIVVKFIEGISAKIPTIVDTAVNIVSKIIETIATVLPKILESGATVVSNIIIGIISALPAILEVALTIINTLINAVVDNLPMIIDTGIKLLDTLIKAVMDNLPIIIDAGIKILDSLIKAITNNLPMLLDAGIKLLNTILDGIIINLPLIIDAAIGVLDTLLNAIVDNLPIILAAGVKILFAVVDGLIKEIPTLLKAALDIIIAISEALIDNLPKILDAGIKILLALIDGIVSILPQLINIAIKLIIEISKALIDNLPKILDAGVKILLALVKGIFSIISELLKAGGTIVATVAKAIGGKLGDIFDKGVEILKKVVSGIKNGIGDMVSIGADIVNGLVRGIWSMADKAWKAAKDIAKGVGNSIKSALGIKSPSRVTMALGVNVGEGFIIGIERMVGGVKQAADEMANAALPDENELSLAYSVPNVSPLGVSYSAAGTADKSNAEVVSESLADALRGLAVEMNGIEVGKIVEKTVTREQAWKGQRMAQYQR